MIRNKVLTIVYMMNECCEGVRDISCYSSCPNKYDVIFCDTIDMYIFTWISTIFTIIICVIKIHLITFSIIFWNV